MRPGTHALLIALCLHVPLASHASHEGIFNIAQPIRVDAGTSGISVSMVPHVGHSIGTRPELLITTTVTPNFVWANGSAQNRNLASIANVQFIKGWQLGPDAGWSTQFMSDTLLVIVDTSEMREVVNFAPDEIVAATLWCGLVNAKQLAPRISIVAYKFTQGSRETNLEGLYSLERVPSTDVSRLESSYNNKMAAVRAGPLPAEE